MRRWIAMPLVLVALGCAARKPAEPAPAAASPDPDVAALGSDCLACHTADLVRGQRLTDKQWAKSLDKMRTWGAPTEDENVAALLAYFATIPSSDATAPPAQRLSTDKIAALFKRTPEGAFGGGDAARGKPLYVDQCAPCHGDDGKGAAMGVALAGRHILDRPSEFAGVTRAGRGRMPEYPATTDAEIADLLAYVRSLSPR